MSAEKKSYCGALLGGIVLAIVAGYFFNNLTKVYLENGYSIITRTDDSFYEDEPLKIVVGKPETNEYEYPFRFILTGFDTETGKYPADVQYLGIPGIYIWEYHFDPKTMDAPISKKTPVPSNFCSSEAIEDLHGDLSDVFV